MPVPSGAVPRAELQIPVDMDKWLETHVDACRPVLAPNLDSVLFHVPEAEGGRHGDDRCLALVRNSRQNFPRTIGAA